MEDNFDPNGSYENDKRDENSSNQDFQNNSAGDFGESDVNNNSSGNQGNPYQNYGGEQGQYFGGPQHQNYNGQQYQNFGGPQYQNYNGQYQNGKMRKPGGDVLAIASMVLGIISLFFFCSCFNIISAIISIVLAIIYLSGYVLKHKNMAISGIVMSVISIILCFVAWGLIITSDSMQAIIKEGGIQQNNEEYQKLIEQYQKILNGTDSYDIDEDSLDEDDEVYDGTDSDSKDNDTDSGTKDDGTGSDSDDDGMI